MKEYGIEPQASTYNLLLNQFIQGGNFELSLRIVKIAREKGFDIELGLANDLIHMCLNLDYPRLALEFGRAYEAEGIRKIEPRVWMRCLSSSAENLWVSH